MTKPRFNPLESYGRELLQILLNAARAKVILNFPSAKGGFSYATSVRQRLYSLRKTMRESKHEHFNLVSGLIIHIEWPEGTELEKVGRNMVPKDRRTPVTLIVDHKDRELKEIAEAAGVVANVDVNTVETLDTEPTKPVVDIERVPEDDLLERILRKES